MQTDGDSHSWLYYTRARGAHLHPAHEGHDLLQSLVTGSESNALGPT